MEKLESVRTTLRRLRSDDFANMRVLETDMLVMKNTPFRVPQTEQQTRERLARQISMQPTYDPYGVWAAELKKDGSFLGWFMLMPTGDGRLELGYMIVREKWGQSLGLEVAKRLIAFAQERPEIEVLIAKSNVHNFASLEILEKLGFKYSSKVPGEKPGDEPVIVYQLRL